MAFTVNTQTDNKENTVSLKTQFCCVMRRQFDRSVYVQHVQHCTLTLIYLHCERNFYYYVVNNVGLYNGYL